MRYMTKEQTVERYMKIALWASARYTTKDGTLTLTVGGEPTAYSRINDAAFDRYVRNWKDPEEVRESLVRFGSDGQRVQYEDADDASEHMLRMAEGWC